MAENTISTGLRALQGYAPSVWLPEGCNSLLDLGNNGRTLLIVHDRRGTEGGQLSEIVVLPGNKPESLLQLGQYAIRDGTGVNVPSSLVWGRHGGPCSKAGANYRTVNNEIMDSIYDLGVCAVVDAAEFGVRSDHHGPYEAFIKDRCLCLRVPEDPRSTFMIQ